jgi:hypothetical protein
MSDDFEDAIGEMPTAAAAPGLAANQTTYAFNDFVAYAPSRNCIYLPCKTPWPNGSIDTRLPRMPMLDRHGNAVVDGNGKPKTITASEWLEKNRSVETFTWAPGEPELIRDRLAVDGGWVQKLGAATLNTYRPPDIVPGDAGKAAPWLNHWHTILPGAEADHCIDWLACSVQHPEIKINHALVLGGAPKIGKDTLLEAVVHAVGGWNYKDIKLTHLTRSNNDFLKAVIVRVNEARDVGEQGHVDRYRLHDHMKDMLASPPATFRVNEKYIKEYYIFNRCGFIITTNHRDALYLPPDDRRHYVVYSESKGEEFPVEYWKGFWAWYTQDDGFRHVAALLRQRDLAHFDPKAPPPKTPAFWHMVEADRGVEYGELADAIDMLGGPPALTLDQVREKAPALEWLLDRRMRRTMPHRLAECHYIAVPNPTAESKMWVINRKRQIIYAREDLTPGQRRDAAAALCRALGKPPGATG